MNLRISIVSGFLLLSLVCFVSAKSSIAMPQRPKFQELLRAATLNKPSSDTSGPIIEAGLLVYESVKKAATWLKGIRDRTTKKEQTLYPDPEEAPPANHNRTVLARLMDEVNVCKPYDSPTQRCYSRCIPFKYYRYCWVTPQLDQGGWSVCTCYLRRSIKEFLAVTKEELLRRHARLQELQQLPVSPTETGLIIFGVCAVLATAVTAACWCRNNKEWHRRLATTRAVAATSTSFRTASRKASQVSCALSRHLPRAPKAPPVEADPTAEATIVGAVVNGKDVEIK